MYLFVHLPVWMLTVLLTGPLHSPYTLETLNLYLRPHIVFVKKQELSVVMQDCDPPEESSSCAL